MDANQCGGWTQVFGGRASEPETCGLVIKCNFSYPICISRSRWAAGGLHWNLVDILCIIKIQRPWDIVQRCLRDPMCSRFNTYLACNRQTDRRTHAHAMTANIMQP